jgi:hypothetical protein
MASQGCRVLQRPIDVGEIRALMMRIVRVRTRAAEACYPEFVEVRLAGKGRGVAAGSREDVGIPHDLRVGVEQGESAGSASRH